MNPKQPIGVFDSGVGGLSVVQELRSRLPGEEIIYFADTAHVPYGGRSHTELLHLGEWILNFFVEHQVKVVVAACNTSSAVSMPILKEHYQIPIITVLEPGAREAARVSHGRIGVMATQTTVGSQAYPRRVADFAPDMEVTQVACPRFVPLIEAGVIEGPEIESVVQEYLEPLLKARIDTLVLGCTHYPFLTPVIRRFLPESVQIIDPALPTITQLELYLNENNLYNSGAGSQYQYYCSGSPQSMYDLDHRILNLGIKQAAVVEMD